MKRWNNKIIMNNLTEWDAEFALLTPAERSYVAAILKSLIPGLTPEEIEAFYDKNY